MPGSTRQEENIAKAKTNSQPPRISVLAIASVAAAAMIAPATVPTTNMMVELMVGPTAGRMVMIIVTRIEMSLGSFSVSPMARPAVDAMPVRRSLRKASEWIEKSDMNG